MALGETLCGRITEMGSWQEGARSATARESGIEVQCALSAGDALGVAVEELDLRWIAPGALSVGETAAWAAAICERVTYLSEPLQLLEVDAVDATALVRSARPRRRGDERSYFELLLRGDRRTSLRRLRTRARSGRPETVPFALTLEQLADLVDDLAAACPVS